MSRFRVLFVTSLILFSGIAMMAMLKKKHDTAIVFKEPKIEIVQPVEIAKVEPVQLVIEEFKPSLPAKKEFIREEVKVVPIQKMVTSEVDRVRRLFSKSGDKLPIVETVTYTSRVSWLKGRPAWIADYASHYNTSRHFIARSLNGKIDYITQKVAPGDKFNVFRQDKNFEFYLLVDLSACQMHFYYLDKDLDERVFLKSYPVGLGRKKEDSPSGSLTPIGKYSLGDKVAVYRSGVQGYYQNQKIEMINVFGTRWLPFGEELENCSDGAKGYGIHGVPCVEVPASGDLVEEHGGVGAYNSDGCIRLKKEDVEEIFSIVITKPTVVEIVKDMKGIKLPMNKEVNY